jgi:hypothetical protein
MSVEPHEIEHQDAPEALEPAGKTRGPAMELRRLLLEAAAQAAELDIDLDTFMKSAWQAYMEARPGLREHLEDLQLVAQIEALRGAGRIAKA